MVAAKIFCGVDTFQSLLKGMLRLGLFRRIHRRPPNNLLCRERHAPLSCRPICSVATTGPAIGDARLRALPRETTRALCRQLSFASATSSDGLLGGTLTLESGKLAGLTDGAVLGRFGDTVVLATAVADASAVDPTGFLPLTVEYREKAHASGKIPRTRDRRDANPTDEEVLAARVIDRVLRPLFPKGFCCETQVIATVQAADGAADPVALAVNAAAAALAVSPLPWAGAAGCVRVARLKDSGQLVVGPTPAQMGESDMDLLYAANEERCLMLEMGGEQIPESQLEEALRLAHRAVQPILAAQRELARAVGRAKRKEPLAAPAAEAVAAAREAGYDQAYTAFTNSQMDKATRGRAEAAALSAARAAVVSAFPPDTPVAAAAATAAAEGVLRSAMRAAVLDSGVRCDGRGLEEIRQLSAEADCLPVVHGSGLFTRGQTQALATVTLGPSVDQTPFRYLGVTKQEELRAAEAHSGMYLHYEFPPYSVNEVGKLGGTNRRAIGHGALAARAVAPVMPARKDHPYITRITSEVTMSNGSSSMATACAASLALMDAGVPILAPVAGISVGMVSEPAAAAAAEPLFGVEVDAAAAAADAAAIAASVDAAAAADEIADVDAATDAAVAMATSFAPAGGAAEELGSFSAESAFAEGGLAAAEDAAPRERAEEGDAMAGFDGAADISGGGGGGSGRGTGGLGRYALLTDILGTEDHYGDMDFKVAGTAAGVTAMQLDVKLEGGVPLDVLVEALGRAATARQQVLAAMAEAIAAPRPSLKDRAPRVQIVHYKPERRKELLGLHGEILREAEVKYNVHMDTSVEGQVSVFSEDHEQLHAVGALLRELVGDVDIGDEFEATVKEVKEFGALVEVLRSRVGLLHASEMTNLTPPPPPRELVSVGQKVRVRCIGSDPLRGIYKLSRKVLLDPTLPDELRAEIPPPPEVFVGPQRRKKLTPSGLLGAEALQERRPPPPPPRKAEKGDGAASRRPLPSPPSPARREWQEQLADTLVAARGPQGAEQPHQQRQQQQGTEAAGASPLQGKAAWRHRLALRMQEVERTAQEVADRNAEHRRAAEQRRRYGEVRERKAPKEPRSPRETRAARPGAAESRKDQPQIPAFLTEGVDAREIAHPEAAFPVGDALAPSWESEATAGAIATAAELNAAQISGGGRQAAAAGPLVVAGGAAAAGAAIVAKKPRGRLGLYYLVQKSTTADATGDGDWLSAKDVAERHPEALAAYLTASKPAKRAKASGDAGGEDFEGGAGKKGRGRPRKPAASGSGDSDGSADASLTEDVLEDHTGEKKRRRRKASEKAAAAGPAGGSAAPAESVADTPGDAALGVSSEGTVSGSGGGGAEAGKAGAKKTEGRGTRWEPGAEGSVANMMAAITSLMGH